MDKKALKKYLPIAGIVVVIAAVIAGVVLFAPKAKKEAGETNEVKIQQPGPALDKVSLIKAANSYVPEDAKKNLAKLQDSGDIYYYAADGNRYIFPNSDIYKSWFGDYQPTRVETIEDMYKTQIKGAVTLKPGSLAMTESDPKVYLVGNHSTMYSLETAIVTQLFGVEWQTKVINLPNWFFAYYNQSGGISAIGALPDLPAKPSIEENLISR